MSTLYMVRHGQTLFNVLRRKQGWCDSPLTELGIEQARAAGRWVADQGLVFDHVYSSTSERCCDTCELVVPGVPYERVKCLKEWNFGKFEGVTEDLNIQVPYGDFYVQFGGEDEVEFRNRLVEGVLELMRRPGHERVLMVSHGGAMSQVPRYFGDDYKNHTDMKRLPNCAICRYEFDGDKTLSLQEVIDPAAC
ncbi:histidine phosphatase family protein [Paratractidigestivibacter sp.]|uniref:histidine phosphatase family protein n=1 Tax=Paratractidigestivibacter sp. TaxID=2847316 RepID=UPI002ABD8411|nr:histidine phosphatase family protein [Paratractidigestivibacter sp.]